MAAIDKIYIGWDDYCKLKEWCESQPPLYDKYGTKCYIKDYLWDLEEEDFKFDSGEWHDRPVMNNPYYIDYYIMKNCDIEGVLEAVGINYGHFPESWVQEYYNMVKDNGGPCGIWKEEDFIVDEDGTVHLRQPKDSTYSRIRSGKEEISPISEHYVAGKHFRLYHSPHDFQCCNFNTCKLGNWMVDVILPEHFGGRHMWYHSYKHKPGTWDLIGDFVCDAECSSSCAIVGSIKALKRKIRKWNLPVGAIVVAKGRYIVEHYEFIVTP